jgi:hypothetical protein
MVTICLKDEFLKKKIDVLTDKVIEEKDTVIKAKSVSLNEKDSTIYPEVEQNEEKLHLPTTNETDENFSLQQCEKTLARETNILRHKRATVFQNCAFCFLV